MFRPSNPNNIRHQNCYRPRFSPNGQDNPNMRHNFHGGASPYGSPNNFNYTPHNHGQRSFHQQSPRHQQFQNPNFSMSPYSYSSPRGNASFSGGNKMNNSHRRFSYGSNNGSMSDQNSSFNKHNFKNKFLDRSDSNPGGSNNIAMYYRTDMLSDPWANLRPVPVQENR